MYLQQSGLVSLAVPHTHVLNTEALMRTLQFSDGGPVPLRQDISFLSIDSEAMA